MNKQVFGLSIIPDNYKAYGPQNTYYLIEDDITRPIVKIEAWEPTNDEPATIGIFLLKPPSEWQDRRKKRIELSNLINDLVGDNEINP